MKHIFVDLEMNKIAKNFREERMVCKYEIMEIGAVMLNDQGEETDTFIRYVKPSYNSISEYYTELTGITNAMVENGPDFKRAIEEFYAWIGEGDYKIYSWSDSDPNQLKRESELKNEQTSCVADMLAHWVDYQKEFDDLLGVERKVGLKDALNAIGVDFEGKQHDAFWDARNTAEIFRLSLDKKRFDEAMKPITDLFKPKKTMGTSLGELFSSEFANLFS